MRMDMKKGLAKRIWMVLRLVGCREVITGQAENGASYFLSLSPSYPTKKEPALWAATPFLSREWREAGREGLELPNPPPAPLLWNAITLAFWCTRKDQHTAPRNTRTASSWLPWELLKSTFLHTFHIPTTSRSCFLPWLARLPLPTYILSCGSHMSIVSPFTMPNLISCSPICLSEISSLYSLLVTSPSDPDSQEAQPHFFWTPSPKLHLSQTLRTADYVCHISNEWGLAQECKEPGIKVVCRIRRNGHEEDVEEERKLACLITIKIITCN